MVHRLSQAVRLLRAGGAHDEIAFEWPRSAQGWWATAAQEFLVEFGFTTECNSDGCMYGWCDEDGRKVQKPWRVSTTTTRLKGPLGRACDRSQRHRHCRGRLGRATEPYTPQLVDAIGHATAGGNNAAVLRGAVAPVVRARKGGPSKTASG